MSECQLTVPFITLEMDVPVTAACTNGIDIGFASLDYLQIAFLGVVQGVTELLPISSTPHMRIVPAVLGWTDLGSAFSAVMQLAALAAVLSYFAKDVRALVGGTVHAVRRQAYQAPAFHMSVGIVLATIPIGVVGLLLSSMLNTCNSPFRGLHVIAIASIFMAVLLAISEWKCTLWTHEVFRTIFDMAFRGLPRTAGTLLANCAECGMVGMNMKSLKRQYEF